MTTLAMLTNSGKCAELVQNGSFDQILVDWQVNESLGSWSPYEYPGGTINLHPSTVEGYSGQIICQALNAPGIANQTVSVAIDLGCDWAPPD